MTRRRDSTVSDNSSIEWTDATWTPIRARNALGKWFCQKISPGCENCYASTFNRRMGGQPYAVVNPEVARALVEAGEIYLDEDALLKPLSWRKPRRVFLSSMTDVFGEWVPDEWLDEIWAMMALARRHTFQVLTKRPRRMRDYLTAFGHTFRVADAMCRLRPDFASGTGPFRDHAGPTFPLSNVWLGVSVESDAYAWRAKVLSEIPAAVRFVSAEPLLGPLPSLDFGVVERDYSAGTVLEAGWPKTTIHFLIVGGESGGPAERRLVERCARWDHVPHTELCSTCTDQRGVFSPAPNNYVPKIDAVQWVRDLRDRATAAGVAFHFKAWGGPHSKAAGRELDGRTWDEFPGGIHA